MSKNKFLEDDASLDYKKRLKEFSQLVNPKKAEKALEKLRQKYLAARVQKNDRN